MANENMIKFYRGLAANLPAAGSDGSLYITTDEGAIYYGTGTGMKRLGDFIQVANVASLPEQAHETCLYYCVAENILAKWNGAEWKQINKQPTAEELKTLLGLGTAAYQNADAFDAAGEAKKVADYVGTFTATEGIDTVVKYIDAKTSNIASDERVNAIDNRVKAIEEDYVKADDIANFETKENVKKVADDLAAYVTSNNAAVDLKADKSVVNAMYTNEQIDTAVQGAKDYAKGLVDALPAQTDYTVTITETTDGLETGVAKKYTFTQNGAEIGSINLAKELVVTSGSVKEVEIADMPYAGAVVGDKYIELVIANQDAPIYVPAKDLVDIYTAKDGAAEVQVAISNTNEISATLVNGGVTEEKLAEGVKTKLNKVWEEAGAAAAAQAAAEATAAAALAAAKTEISAEIDADVKVVADDLATYKTSNNEALAFKANAANVYAKTETYTQEEVDAAIVNAVEAALTWGEF